MLLSKTNAEVSFNSAIDLTWIANFNNTIGVWANVADVVDAVVCSLKRLTNFYASFNFYKTFSSVFRPLSRKNWTQSELNCARKRPANYFLRGLYIPRLY